MEKLISFTQLIIFGNLLHLAEKVKNLGVLLNADSSFADHVCNICMNCFVQLHDLRHMRQSNG